ncbi:MAG: hypothetical protein AAB519_00185 [Patescibacteria group bacterium]
MAKTNKDEEVSSNARLQEIGEMRFGTLSDEQILSLLVERKRLFELETEKQKKEEQDALFQSKKKELLEKIEVLNAAISPDKEDEELLHLVEERKKLEEELDSLEGVSSEEAKPAPVLKEETVPESVPEKEMSRVPEEIVSQEEEKKEESIHVSEPASVIEEKKEETIVSDFGGEGRLSDTLEESGEMQQYIHELEANRESLGSFLQGVSAVAKKNRKFMERVAEIDPAYAMHYADPSLKKDEGFNVFVASRKNDRNSGNALAEMLPEARTGKVVLAGTKQDYRNVRFLLPTMAEYDEVLQIAKQGALEKVDELKEAADVMLLIPKILQKDGAFMKEVEKKAGLKK